MKTILIYGAGGFIGKKLAEKMSDDSYRVVAVIREDCSKDCKIANNENIKYVKCDLKNVEDKLETLINEKVDTVYYLAWDGLDNESLSDYSRQLDNVKYMLDLMKCSSKLGAKRFIGSGSMSQLELLSPVGREYVTDKHKYYRSAMQACEDMGKALAAELGMCFIWPLITNVYGKGETNPTRFINSLVHRLSNGEDVPVSQCEHLYDFLNIEDAAEMFLRLESKGISGKRYIFGSGKPRPLKEYLEIVKNNVKSDADILYGKLDYKGVWFSENDLDAKELLVDIDYTPHHTFEAGIKAMIEEK